MSSQKNVTEEMRTLGALLRLPYQALACRTYTELARTFPEIRPAHSSVFRNILPEGSRVTELADRAQMTKQSMGYLVDYLHEHGYVEFVSDPTDGRAKLVCLTERGQAFQRAAIVLSKRCEDDVAAHMGREEMDRLRELLERLNAVLETDGGERAGGARTSRREKHGY